MKKEKEQKLYWRRLDNSAKIFPISAGKKYSTVFRLSVVLKENVNPRVLEKALQNALETYQSFKVRMKAGLFWYYLEHNPKDPIIEEEKEKAYPDHTFFGRGCVDTKHATEPSGGERRDQQTNL